MINLTQQMAGLIKKTAPAGCRFADEILFISISVSGALLLWRLLDIRHMPYNGL